MLKTICAKCDKSVFIQEGERAYRLFGSCQCELNEMDKFAMLQSVVEVPEPITMNRCYEAIRKGYEILQPIDWLQWITGAYTDGEGCDATGHLSRLTSRNPENFSPLNCSRNFSLEQAITYLTFGRHRLSKVNDGLDGKYIQVTEKARVIALLEDVLRL